MNTSSKTLAELLNEFPLTGPTFFVFGTNYANAYATFGAGRYLMCRNPDSGRDFRNMTETEWGRLFPCQPVILKPVFDALLDMPVNSINAVTFEDRFDYYNEFGIDVGSAVQITVLCDADQADQWNDLFKEAKIPVIGLAL